MPYAGCINEFESYSIWTKQQSPKTSGQCREHYPYKNNSTEIEMMSLQFTSMSLSGISCQEGLKYLKKSTKFHFSPEKNKVYGWGNSAYHVDNENNSSGQFLNLHGDSSIKLQHFVCFPQSSRPIKWSTACLGGFTWMAMQSWMSKSINTCENVKPSL